MARAVKPLLVTWRRYEPGGANVTRLVLFRNENGGPFKPVATFTDLSVTEYTDANVRHNKKYCYRLTAETADGKQSEFSQADCARPRK